MGRFPKTLSFGFHQKLFMLLALPVLITMAAITFVSASTLETAVNRQYEDKARAIIDGFKADIISLDLTTVHLQSELETYAELDPTVFKISVYAPRDNKIIRIASTAREQIGTEADPEDIEPFRTNQTLWFEATKDGMRFAEVLAPIQGRDTSQPVAAVGVYLYLDSRDEIVKSQRLAFASIGALGTLFLLSLLYWAISKLILSPMSQLAEARLAATKSEYEAGSRTAPRNGSLGPGQQASSSGDLDKPERDRQSTGLETKTSETGEANPSIELLPMENFTWELQTNELGPLTSNAQSLILLVEGNRERSEVLSEWISNAGYSVARATYGKQVVRLAYELEPFAVVLNMILPDKDGWQVLRDLKTLPDTLNIPVVIVSSLEAVNKGFSLGAVDYFTKPIDRDRLLDRLKRLNLVGKRDSKPRSILVVDKGSEAVGLLTQLFQPQPVQIIRAYGERQAFSFALEHQPDLVVLDLLMPNLNGFTTLIEMRKHPATSQIPVILLTGENLTPEANSKLDGDVGSVSYQYNFSREEFLGEIAKLEAAYPEKARLIDPSIELLTRAGFRRQLAQVFRMAERYSIPVTVVQARAALVSGRSVVMTYGCPVECTRELARLLKGTLKPRELAADLGEGHFAIILPEAEKSAGSARAGELQRVWATYHFQPAGARRPQKLDTWTAVVTYPVDADCPEQLMARAQEAIDVQGKRRL